MAVSTTSRRAVHALNDTASVLKGADGIPIPQKIRMVFQELFKGKRPKPFEPEGNEIPETALEVLHEIRDLVHRMRASAADLIQSKAFTFETIKNLELVKAFVESVFVHYHSESKLFAGDIKKTLTDAIDDGFAAISIISISGEIKTLVDSYNNTMDISAEEFKRRLEIVAVKIEEIENQTKKRAPTHEDSPILWAEITHLKEILETARKFYNVSEPPGITGKNAVNLLRMANEMIQSAKSYHEIIKVLEIVKEANKHLTTGGEKFQKEGQIHLMAIKEKIHLFLRKQVPTLRHEILGPVVFVPTDVIRNQKLYEEISRQRGRLMEYHELAALWTGEHKRDIVELIRDLIEGIDSRTQNIVSYLQKHQLQEQAEKFQKLLNQKVAG